jgi:adenylate cyclase
MPRNWWPKRDPDVTDGWQPPALVARLLNFGTEGLPKRTVRSLRLVNAICAIAFLNSVFFGVRYALIDLPHLWPLVAWVAATTVLWAVPPLYGRLGSFIPATLLVVVALIIVGGVCYLAGPASGVQYFLLVCPVVLFIFGSRHVTYAVVLSIICTSFFLVIHLGWLPDPMAPLPDRSAKLNTVIVIVCTVGIIFITLYYAIRIADDAEMALEAEFARSESLLLNLMPVSVAQRLKRAPDVVIADNFDQVTVLFADIVDFTTRASRLPPAEVVGFLNRIFSVFDHLAAKYDLEKIKTIGDAYMIAGGMPDRREGHARDVGLMALDMIAATHRLGAENGESIEVRIGIHAGPAVAGVIGTRKLFYDVWGDTVNTASRMESHGKPGKIQVTEDARAALGSAFRFEERGTVDIKGKGPMRLYFLTGCERVAIAAVQR